MDKEEIIDIIEKFKTLVIKYYGIYLDCNMGFAQTLETFTTGQKALAERIGNTIEEQDSLSFAIKAGDNDPPMHEETQGEFKKRMADGGKNQIFVGNTFVITIYAYWEDYYRGKIAQAMVIDKNKLKGPIMGDLRLLRNSIIHHQSIALKEIEKCEIIKWFKKDDPIQFSKHNIDELYGEIMSYIEFLLLEQAD